MRLSTFISTMLCSLIFVGCTDNTEPPFDKDNTPATASTEVTVEQAQSDLEALLSDIEGSESRHGHTRQINGYWSTSAAVESRADDTGHHTVHIFNFEDEQGYAIMSGDTRVPSLIALADSGSLNEGDVIDNPGLGIFLECAAEYIDNQTDARNVRFKPTDETNDDLRGPSENSPGGPLYSYSYGPWKNIVYHQGGICPVKWGQDKPYNKYCPTVNGRPCATGCVATAVAQLMTVYKHPASYSVYSFNWNAMTASPYAGSCTYDAQDNIARLMQQLGLKKNLDMNYGVEASGAYSSNIPRTLKSFGYRNPGSRSNYSQNAVVTELKNGYPVLLDGYSYKKKILGVSVTYKGGHEWLAHGLLERRREVKKYKMNSLVSTNYESQWYILCNWGWGRHFSNGYYLSSVFNAKAGPTYLEDAESSRATTLEGEAHNYQFNVNAITGIRK